MRRALVPTLLSGLTCLVLVAVALAQEPPATEQAAAEPEHPAEDGLTPEDRARRAKVIAKVGDVDITVGEVEDAVNEQSPFLRVRYRDPAQLQDLVQSMIRFELLARAAEQAGMGENDDVQHVVKQSAVQQLVRRDFDERLTVESIPEPDVQQYYDAHPDEFSRPELRRAAHIQVASREEAERLITKVRDADVREFRRLAREQSLDPETRLRGGDLRYFDADGRAQNTRDPRIDEALARAAFALAEVGDVAPEPIQVGERFSVLELTGMRPAEHRTLEQSAPTIRLRLWRERRQQALEDFEARLRREAHVQAHYDRLRAIRLDPPEPGPGEGAQPVQAPQGAEQAKKAAAEAQPR